MSVWRPFEKRVVTFLDCHGGDSVTCVAFSPRDGILASGGWDSNVRLWDVATSKQIAVLKGHRTYVNALAFSSDGETLASASMDSTIRLWNVGEDAKESKKLVGHTTLVLAIAFAPHRRVLVSGGGGEHSFGLIRFSELFLWTLGREDRRIALNRIGLKPVAALTNVTLFAFDDVNHVRWRSLITC